MQNFGWAVEHDKWQARVASIPRVFQAATADLSKTQCDKEVVQAVWQRIMPGLLQVGYMQVTGVGILFLICMEKGKAIRHRM